MPQFFSQVTNSLENSNTITFNEKHILFYHKAIKTKKSLRCCMTYPGNSVIQADGLKTCKLCISQRILMNRG